MQTSATIYSWSSTLSGPSAWQCYYDILVGTLTHSPQQLFPISPSDIFQTANIVCSLLSEESLASYFAMKTEAIRRELLPLPDIQHRNSHPYSITVEAAAGPPSWI